MTFGINNEWAPGAVAGLQIVELRSDDGCASTSKNT